MMISQCCSTSFASAGLTNPRRTSTCYILPQRRYVCRPRATLKLKPFVSLRSLGLRAKRPVTCLQICQCNYDTGSCKLVGIQGLPSVYTPESWSWFPSSSQLDRKPSPFPLNRLRSDVGVADGSAAFSGLCSRPLRCSAASGQFSRAARMEAQEAFMDYLHGTRSLHYTDAEYISKNSPNFLLYLLAKAGSVEEVRRSVSKFLRYHPINEFEPFFESLGLKPSEIHPILPRHLIYLADDNILLRNFHLLCNYGFPRRSIGKMYKEAPEIFRYDRAVLEAKIQAYEELGLSNSTVVKLVSCCPSLLVGGVNRDFVQVLEKLFSFGFGCYWIRGCLSEGNRYHWDRMLHMMEFLNEMGCSEEDLRNLIGEHPWFLFHESGEKIYLAVALLLKLGLKMNRILRLLLQNPEIVSGSFVKNLFQSIQFLSEIGMERVEIARIVCSHPHALAYCLLKKPEDVLSTLNLDQQGLCDAIKKDPHWLTYLASKTKRTTLLATSNRPHPLEKTTFLLKLGFLENSDEMATAQKQFRGRGDRLQERFNVLLNAGLDFQDACNLVKEAPQILNQTAEVLEKKIDYLVNCAGYPLNSIISFPTYLCYNLDKIKVRFSMFQWLKGKGVTKPNVALSSVIASSNSRFERFYVNLIPEGPVMWEKLNQSFSV